MSSLSAYQGFISNNFLSFELVAFIEIASFFVFWKRISSLALSLLYGPTLTSMHDYWKNYSFDYTDLHQQSGISAFKNLSNQYRIQDTGCLGLVHGDDPERWYGVRGGRGGSGLGTHVHPWLIRVNVWQNQYSIVKQNKVKLKIKKNLSNQMLILPNLLKDIYLF